MTFRRLYGLPCWDVRRGTGSFLTLEFGRPHLRVHEPYQTGSASRRLQRLAARRLVYTQGDWHLWIYCCDWGVFEGSRLVGDSETRRRIDRAAGYLNGQKLVSAQIIPRGMRTLFEFDLGGRLETKPYDRTSKQWFLYGPDGNVLTVRADKRYSYGPGNRHPDRERWLDIDAWRAIRSNEPDSEFVAAAYDGKLDTVRAALDRGADIDVRDQDGCTALHLAMAEGYEEIVKLLIDESADTKAIDNEGFCLLHWAVFSRDTALLALAYEHDQEIDRRDADGRTPLSWTVSLDLPSGARWLLGKGADPGCADDDGWTPLHYAASHGSAEVVTILLTAGASGHAVDKNGRTPSALTEDKTIRRLLAGTVGGGGHAV